MSGARSSKNLCIKNFLNKNKKNIIKVHTAANFCCQILSSMSMSHCIEFLLKNDKK